MDTIVIELPIPFKNIIACSLKANFIYSMNSQMNIECHSLSYSNNSTNINTLNDEKDQGQRSKGHFIKTSDNG